MNRPKALGQLLQTLPTTNSCTTVSNASPDASLVQKRDKWGRTECELLARFNLDVQRFCVRNADRCFSGDAPTLWEVRTLYSPAAADSWLDIQLSDLVAFCGVKKETFAQIVEPLIAVLADNFGFLKLSEWMLFFQQFKAGRYGRFYGSVDPMIITGAVQAFLSFRAGRLASIERQRQHAARREHEEQRAEQERRGALLTAEEWREVAWLFNL